MREEVSTFLGRLWRSVRALLVPQANVMSLLILLSIPAIAGILCMAVALTNLVLYPRLKGRSCQAIEVPARVGQRPRQRAA